jgi:hypothetical protein
MLILVVYNMYFDLESMVWFIIFVCILFCYCLLFSTWRVLYPTCLLYLDLQNVNKMNCSFAIVLNCSYIDWRRFWRACMVGFLLPFFAFLFLQTYETVGSGRLIQPVFVFFLLFCVLQCHCLVIYLAYVRLWSNSGCSLLKPNQTPRPLVRKRTIPTNWPPLVDEI